MVFQNKTYSYTLLEEKKNQVKNNINFFMLSQILGFQIRGNGNSKCLPDKRGDYSDIRFKGNNPEICMDFTVKKCMDVIGYTMYIKDYTFPEAVNFLYKNISGTSSERTIAPSRSKKEKKVVSNTKKTIEEDIKSLIEELKGKYTKEENIDYILCRGEDPKDYIGGELIKEKQKELGVSKTLENIYSDIVGIPLYNSKRELVGLQGRVSDKTSKIRYIPLIFINTSVNYPDNYTKNGIFITEGHFKSKAIARDLHCPSVALSSVNTRSGILEELEGILENYGRKKEEENIIIALDMDIWKEEKKELLNNLWSIGEILKEESYNVRVALWSEKYKGIDDYINAVKNKDPKIAYPNIAIIDFDKARENYKRNHCPIDLSWGKGGSGEGECYFLKPFNEFNIWNLTHSLCLFDRLQFFISDRLIPVGSEKAILPYGLNKGEEKAFYFARDKRSNRVYLLNLLCGWISEKMVENYLKTRYTIVRKSGCDKGYTFLERGKNPSSDPDFVVVNREDILVEVIARCSKTYELKNTYARGVKYKKILEHLKIGEKAKIIFVDFIDKKLIEVDLREDMLASSSSYVNGLNKNGQKMNFNDEDFKNAKPLRKLIIDFFN